MNMRHRYSQIKIPGREFGDAVERVPPFVGARRSRLLRDCWWQFRRAELFSGGGRTRRALMTRAFNRQEVTSEWSSDQKKSPCSKARRTPLRVRKKGSRERRISIKPSSS